MSRIKYQMRVTKIIDHTELYRELYVETIEPKEFTFKAGQFVMLHVPGGEKPALRAYSIASTDQDKNGFKLIFRYVNNGVASKYVWDLKEQAELTFTGPFGRLFFDEPPTEQIVFLNTGSGISQHYCYMESKIKQYPNLKYRMLIGLTDESCIYYHNELSRLQGHFSDFLYDYVLSKANDTWTGKRGHVQNHLNDYDYKTIPTTFYLCGNGNMIKEVKHQLIEIDGINPARVHAEAFD